MLKLQYDLGHSPINIYTDRPNFYLGQLSEINVRFFIIGMFNKPIMHGGFSKIERITPDIRPSLVLSQTKFENFEVLRSIANDYRIPFVHYETNLPPNRILPAKLEEFKSMLANINIFSDPFIMGQWGLQSPNGWVIENGWDVNQKIGQEEGPYYISTNLPIAQMAKGLCPIVLRTPYSQKYITNGLNGFLYDSESQLSTVVNNLNKMDKEDVVNIGKYAQKTVSENFAKEKFLNAWKKILRSAI